MHLIKDGGPIVKYGGSIGEDSSGDDDSIAGFTLYSAEYIHEITTASL